jgi:polysaccharide deacetylase 2 family uncharacterized protein YibQ
VNAAALLGRLKIDLKGFGMAGLTGRLSRLMPGRRAASGAASGERGGWLGRVTLPRPPPDLLAVLGGLVALVLGLGVWLTLAGPSTLEQRSGRIPRTTVAVIEITPPTPPEGAPAPSAAKAAPDALAPAPAAVAAAPAAPPRVPPAGGPLAGMPAPDAPVTMTPAPAQGLVQDSRYGPLPRVADDGRKPWQVYGRPYGAGDRFPRIAMIMAEMGLSGVTTGNALQKLPGGVTFAFVPFSEHLDVWVERARNGGHEVVLSVPMEPVGFPREDPGPHALLTGLSSDRNMDRLEWSLARFTGYVGVLATNAGKYTASADAMKLVMDVLKKRGLLYVEARAGSTRSQGMTVATQLSVPRAVVDRVIDRDLARGAIDDQLAALEDIARRDGVAVGMGTPYPSTIERINLWLTSLGDRGIALAPLSAVIDKQKNPGG